jgi:sortase (surface protein transpeptidase)
MPATLRIRSIGVEAQVEAVGVDANGEMVIPGHAKTVVWYRGSARPGEQGNAVIAGHLDWKGEVGAFVRLKDLAAGAPVEVVREGGSIARYAAKDRLLVPAVVSDAELDAIYGPTPKPSITMITCGGAFDAKTRDYSHRLIVRAEAL